jgi:hypothetical protein
MCRQISTPLKIEMLTPSFSCLQAVDAEAATRQTRRMIAAATKLNFSRILPINVAEI